MRPALLKAVPAMLCPALPPPPAPLVAPAPRPFALAFWILPYMVVWGVRRLFDDLLLLDL